LKRALRWLLAGAALAPLLASAQAAISLERCLTQFEGIQWKLPYRPYMHVHACAGPEGFFSAGYVRPGQRVVEFIGDTSLAPSRNGMRAEDFGQVQLAVFAHFDKLFQRHGIQRFELQESDNEGTRYPAVARYRRYTGSGPVVLVWKPMAANTWQVLLESGAAAAAK
jgi:hypothetical protein